MDGDFNLVSLIRWLWKHKGILFIVEVIAITAPVVFTSKYFMRPLYKSYAVVYPANFDVQPSEVAAQQLSQYLRSVDVKNAVIRKLNLIKHYKIDTASKYWYSNLLGKYDNCVRINITDYNAALIEAMDPNADTACIMANEMIAQVNNVILEDKKQKAMEFAAIYKKQLNAKKKEIDSLASFAKVLSVQYGLLDYNSQSKEVERAYYQMLASSKGGKAIDETTNQIKNLEEKGEQYKEVNQHLTDALLQYDDIMGKYDEAVRDANKQQTFVSVVSKPFPADRTSYPRRWFFTFIAAVSAFVFAAIVLRFIEKLKQKPA